MTLTTQVRINFPVPAMRLLDHVTTIAGGDPTTVARTTVNPGDPLYAGSTSLAERYLIRNRAGQGLATLAYVAWSERPDVGDDEWPEPPALVVLSIDNPYGTREKSGRDVQAYRILPAVAEFLDGLDVPRSAWWWADETAGTFHPGTTDVRLLAEPGEREEWVPA